MKKLVSVFLACLLVCVPLLLTSCGKKPVIGIIQFGAHASLNNCYEGILKGLEENGIRLEDYEVEYVDSNFEMTVSQSQANKMVNEGAKIIIAIATPSAVAAATASDGAVPVVYCAITDGSVMANYKSVTGSSDVPNFAKQLEVVTAVMNKQDLKIGVLYSTEESSSPFQIAELKKAAAAYAGMEIVDSAVADINVIDTKVNALIDAGVNCFVNLLDNTIVGKLESNILPLTDAAGIPVFGSEIEQVKVGCAASASIEYIDVGRAAGASAAKILGGTKAEDIPVAVVSEPTYCYNSAVCQKLNLTLPTTLEGAEDVAK